MAELCPPELATVKVLLWNIGQKNKVPRLIQRNFFFDLVDHVNPDVLLLQESNLTQLPDDDVRVQKYQMIANKTESQVLYDPQKFAFFPTSWLASVINAIEGGSDVIDIFNERVSIAGLEYKHTHKRIFFMSFHNVHPFKNKRCRLAADVFCDMVVKMRDETQTDVVAGADFNYQIKHHTIPKYAPTERRKYGVIDNFSLAPQEENPSVRAVIQPLHAYLHAGINYSFCDVFDHDPLLYEFDIRKNKMENYLWWQLRSVLPQEKYRLNEKERIMEEYLEEIDDEDYETAVTFFNTTIYQHN